MIWIVVLSLECEEFGVYYGATLRSTAIHLARQGSPSHQVYGFDSFQGLVEDWTNMFPEFGFSTEGEVPADLPPNAKLVIGWYTPFALSCFICHQYVSWRPLQPFCDSFMKMIRTKSWNSMRLYSVDNMIEVQWNPAAFCEGTDREAKTRDRMASFGLWHISWTSSGARSTEASLRIYYGLFCPLFASELASGWSSPFITDGSW